MFAKQKQAHQATEAFKWHIRFAFGIGFTFLVFVHDGPFVVRVICISLLSKAGSFINNKKKFISNIPSPFVRVHY